MIPPASPPPGDDSDLFGLFVQAGTNLHRAAELLDEMLGSFPDSRHLSGEIRDCEHTGDQITHALVERMNRASATPIDREDVLQLASALDDVVDYTEEVADFLGLYRIEAPMDQAQQLAEILSRATGQLAAALPMLRGFRDAQAHVIEIHRLENEGDTIVRGAIASLFQPGIDPIAVIRWKDIFERLEQAIDSTERAAYILEGILVKNA